MLFPKKVKHRKWQTARRNPNKNRVDVRGSVLSFGSFGLKAMSYGRLNSNQLESSRKAISRYLKKGGKMWTRVFPDRPYTAKAAEVGMGKGKGDPQGYCFEVYPGRVLFELDGLDTVMAKEALRKAGAKLPMKVKIVSRQ
jgi:large subunit ribosomal protein L16